MGEIWRKDINRFNWCILMCIAQCYMSHASARRISNSILAFYAKTHDKFGTQIIVTYIIYVYMEKKTSYQGSLSVVECRLCAGCLHQAPFRRMPAWAPSGFPFAGCPHRAPSQIGCLYGLLLSVVQMTVNTSLFIQLVHPMLFTNCFVVPQSTWVTGCSSVLLEFQACVGASPVIEMCFA